MSVVLDFSLMLKVEWDYFFASDMAIWVPTRHSRCGCGVLIGCMVVFSTIVERA